MPRIIQEICTFHNKICNFVINYPINYQISDKMLSICIKNRNILDKNTSISVILLDNTTEFYL